jgi:hypothetical protein
VRCPNCKQLLAETVIRGFKKVTCGNCMWEKPVPQHLDNRGRPKREHMGLTPYDIKSSDNDAPAWFWDAMMMQEKWITVQEFAKRFGTHPTQVRRWCDAGLIHCAWTDHVYRKVILDPDLRLLHGLRGQPSKGNVLRKHYTYHRPEGKGHRRIPPSEVERCHFLKLRKHKRVVKTVEKPPVFQTHLSAEIDLKVFEEK